MDNIIIGGGITGLCAAFFLKSNYEIYEKTDHIGGMASSIFESGFTFDYGEKFIRIPNEMVMNFFQDLMQDNFSSQDLVSRIYIKKKFIKYPFQSNLRDLPPKELKKCAKTVIFNYIEKVENKKHHKNLSYANFEDFIFREYGEYIANEFMIPYNEKIWSISPQKMNTNWFLGPNFMPSTNLDQIIDSLFPKDEEDPPVKRWYPKSGGSQAIANAFLSKISNLFLNHTLKSIDLKKKMVIFENGISKQYKNLISTIPLNELLEKIIDIPEDIKNLSKELKYNSVFCLNLGLKKKKKIPCHWIYFPEKEIPFARLFFTENFSSYNVPNGKSSCSALLTFSPEQEFNEQYITKQIINKLIELNIIQDESDIILQIPFYIKYGFTIPTLGLSQQIAKIKSFLIEKDIFTIGRYGEWKYSGIEHAIEDGKNIAQLLLSK